jgi:hypothetical protein
MDVLGYAGLGEELVKTETAHDGKALVRLMSVDSLMVRMPMDFEEQFMGIGAEEPVVVVYRGNRRFMARLEVYASSRAWSIWDSEVSAEEGGAAGHAAEDIAG